jgi:hypothetical protein
MKDPLVRLVSVNVVCVVVPIRISAEPLRLMYTSYCGGMLQKSYADQLSTADFAHRSNPALRKIVE